MSKKLDMSLDDVIMNSRRSGEYSGTYRGRGRASGPGPDRRFATRTVPRMAPYYPPQPMPMIDPNFQQQMTLGGGHNTEEGTKLYISNLDYGVSNGDIQVLFSEVGELKRYSIHYDRSGRSKGTAEVVFFRQLDAVAAVKRYNNVQLDGKPMKIELVGVNLVTPAVVPPSTSSILGKPIGILRRVAYGSSSHHFIVFNIASYYTSPPVHQNMILVVFGSGEGRAGLRDWVHGGGFGRGLARGRAQGKGRVEKLTAEDLDADLEKYRLEAMQIN